MGMLASLLLLSAAAMALPAQQYHFEVGQTLSAPSYAARDIEAANVLVLSGDLICAWENTKTLSCEVAGGELSYHTFNGRMEPLDSTEIPVGRPIRSSWKGGELREILDVEEAINTSDVDAGVSIMYMMRSALGAMRLSKYPGTCRRGESWKTRDPQAMMKAQALNGAASYRTRYLTDTCLDDTTAVLQLTSETVLGTSWGDDTNRMDMFTYEGRGVVVVDLQTGMVEKQEFHQVLTRSAGTATYGEIYGLSVLLTTPGSQP